MTIAPDNAQHGASHLYRAMRDFVESTAGTLPGKFEITKEGIVLDMMSPVRPHELSVRVDRSSPQRTVLYFPCVILCWKLTLTDRELDRLRRSEVLSGGLEEGSSRGCCAGAPNALTAAC